jgi:hypothetical protein
MKGNGTTTISPLTNRAMPRPPRECSNRLTTRPERAVTNHHFPDLFPSNVTSGRLKNPRLRAEPASALI